VASRLRFWTITYKIGNHPSDTRTCDIVTGEHDHYDEAEAVARHATNIPQLAPIVSIERKGTVCGR
jgi:hypothetical protein